MDTRATGWRRIANAMWTSPNDPQIFGSLDVDAEPLLAFIECCRTVGYRLTPTTLVGRAVAHALQQVPEVNVQLRGGRFIQRDSIDVFFITAVSAGRDLSGVKVGDIDHKSAIAVAHELAERSTSLKTGTEPEFARTKHLLDALPPRILRVALRLGAIVTERLRKDIPALGLHPTPFGSAMVSSVGMLGLPQGFAPLAWMYDVPLLILVGEIAEKPVVVDGNVVSRRVLPLCATIDHRYADGWHISRLVAAVRDYLADPDHYEYGHGRC
jgi:pyruvate dehydrogenase E2 component (dihydrolipoamide acetyltransferase)